ncbi:hypothetical protein NS115_18155, partial [Paenibacillus jamilae]
FSSSLNVLFTTTFFFAHRTRVCLLKQAEILKEEDLKTAKAYHLSSFSKLWKQETPEKAKVFWDDWYFWATHMRLLSI